MLVITQLATVVGAAGIMPLWENTIDVACEVTFDETEGTVMSYIHGYDDVTAITGTLVLYEGYREIMSWDIDEEDGYWSVLYAFDAVKGKTYRLELEAEVYMDGLWESVEISESAKCQ
jgi:hypothetical protein